MATAAAKTISLKSIRHNGDSGIMTYEFAGRIFDMYQIAN
jgi:hypothetical protein